MCHQGGGFAGLPHAKLDFLKMMAGAQVRLAWPMCHQGGGFAGLPHAKLDFSKTMAAAPVRLPGQCVTREGALWVFHTPNLTFQKRW